MCIQLGFIILKKKDRMQIRDERKWELCDYDKENKNDCGTKYQISVIVMVHSHTTRETMFRL